MMMNHSTTIPNQTFVYIQSMLTELRILSEKENAPMLAYLIEMAIIEADDMVHNIHVTRSGYNKSSYQISSMTETAG